MAALGMLNCGAEQACDVQIVEAMLPIVDELVQVEPCGSEYLFRARA